MRSRCPSLSVMCRQFSQLLKMNGLPGGKNMMMLTPKSGKPILSFLKAAIPKREVDFPQISLEQWRSAIAKKKKAAAVGPDGVSRMDMLKAPEVAHRSMIDMITAIEAGQAWPSQAVTGHVAALAKTPQAETIQQYRPICVFSLFYRTWGSLRARQCLRYLLDIVPHTLHGNIPGRSPKQVWFMSSSV